MLKMLKLENVTIKFGGLTAVDNLSFEIEKNKIFGLIGPNGAGKTTAFNIISGVYKPTSGNIYLNGNPITGFPPYKTNAIGISRTYQNIFLFKHMTVRENVMVGQHSRTKCGLFSSIFHTGTQRKEEREINEKAEEILEFVGLNEKKDYLAMNLSYGEQRLLEIARGMASGPQLLLLDEPAAGMNIKEKNDLKQLIQKIREKGITILLVEHDMKLVMGITDTVCVLNYGKKICEGEPRYVQNNPEVIEAYLGGVNNNGKNA
jgi:branched-chain amino acid transport system ATP-binding protein